MTAIIITKMETRKFKPKRRKKKAPTCVDEPNYDIAGDVVMGRES